MPVLALDLGTGSCKGALYSEEGEPLAAAARGYGVERPTPEAAEQSPAAYLKAAREVCRELARPDIAAVGLSTQTPTLIFCDEAGHPLGPAILWQDSRGLPDPTLPRDWFGLDLPLGAASTPAKLLWMARERPAVWGATRWVLQPKDYLLFHLTGELATDHWCAKGLLHLATGESHPGWLARLGKRYSLAPRPRYPQETAGRVRGDDFGLRPGTAVTAGWSDALAAVLATGAFHGPRGFILTGTSEIVGVSCAPQAPAPGLFWVPASILDLHGWNLHYGPTQAGGNCLDWLANLFARPATELLAAAAPLGPVPVLCRPYLLGERAPYWDHRLTASFEGVRAEHRLPHFVQAVLQGVALHERLVLERAEGQAPVSDLVLAGGAARDAAWNQLRAHILQRRLWLLRDPEASLRGAALLAWAAAGAFDLKHPPAAWFAFDTVLPDAAHAALAAELMARFRLAGSFSELPGSSR